MGDPLHKTHNREVKDATERMFTEIIPNFVAKAKELENKTIQLSATDGNLVKEMHKEGKSRACLIQCH